uniref:Uncharacterized protein n=1 Tax=Picea glauca TaxID=3330 RepID=A0A101M317_PICGL|nr:hypothetical protein ABT39_MTgene3369 [Picea glauca]
MRTFPTYYCISHCIQFRCLLLFGPYLLVSFEQLIFN